jgi:carbon storage regulator
MLVLTRRKNQSIVIGDQIIVTVLEVKGDQIRLGITAPRDVQVYREELLADLTEANRSAVLTEGAAQSAPPAPGARAAMRLRARRVA